MEGLRIDSVFKGARKIFNFISGAGISLTATDSPDAGDNEIEITVALGGSGAATLEDLTVTDDLTVGDDITLASGSVLTWAADTNLYRSAANTLKTDDSLVVDQTLTVGDTTADANAAIVFGKNVTSAEGGLPQVRHGSDIGAGSSSDLVLATTSTSGGIVFRTGVSSTVAVTTGPGNGTDKDGFRFGTAADTNLYRSATNTLKTDDNFNVNGTVYLDAGGLVGSQYLVNFANTGPYFQNNGNTILVFNRTTTSNVVFQVRGMASQTGDLQRWEVDGGAYSVYVDAAARLHVSVVATGSLPAAAAAMDGTILIEDGGAGNRNLVIYGGGERFRIDGGAAF